MSSCNVVGEDFRLAAEAHLRAQNCSEMIMTARVSARKAIFSWPVQELRVGLLAVLRAINNQLMSRTV